MKHRKKIIPLPFTFYFWPVVALALIGFLDSLYLAISHYRVYTDITYESFCAISKAINCDTVSQSVYALMLDVPLAVWGMLGYLTLLTLFFIAYRDDNPGTVLWPSIFLISLCFSIHSIFLALVSSLIIKSYCIMCVVTYSVNLMLLFYSHLIYKRFGSCSFIHGIRNDVNFVCSTWRKSVVLGLLLVLIGAGLVFFYPKYWHMEPLNIRQDMPTGLTQSGHPWIGAENPELVVIEFSDYQCYQCRKMYYFLRRLMSKHPGKLRIVHRHFPMDNQVNPIVTKPLHYGSGKLAMMAIYALERGKFWEMNDQLFSLNSKEGIVSFKELAGKTGLDERGLARSVKDRRIMQKLWDDIREGIRIGMNGTPGYVIDGKLHSATIPPEILKKIIQ